MPKRKKPMKRREATPEEPIDETSGPAVRPIWSGTITFGLVSIPVDLLSAVRPRQTAMKLIDKEGHALGRQYHCSKEGTKLDYEDLVRGYETEDGKMVTITDEEFESAAPEMSADIELRSFVRAEEIPPVHFQKPYFLAPAGKSSKAYNLLAATMERTGRVGIGSFVMRGQEYLVAIVPDHGVLRAATLRYADEIRTPESIDLPAPSKIDSKLVSQFAKDIDDLKRKDLNMSELEDKEAEELQAIVKAKEKDKENVIQQQRFEADDAEDEEGGGKVIDFMEVLRRSLSNRAVVTYAEKSEPISLAERRALQQGATRKTASKPKGARKSTKERR